IDFEEATIDVNKLMYKRNCGLNMRKTLAVKGMKEEKSGWYLGSTKTPKSNRKIKIGSMLLKELKEFRAIQLQNQLQYGEYYHFQYLKDEKDEKGFPIQRIMTVESYIPVALPKAEFVFKKENGELSTMDSFKYASRVIHYDLCIDFNFHSLRHTHATMLIESGVSPKAVQERLGHDRIETTLQTYTHNTEEMAQGAVDVFEERISKQIACK
ncbi:MAG: tyrosine-type recombinase/integrase, partial [Holdemanella sp.]|nr:tyrosine-type recombinase/integrase [Holdemanella sp.]